jgi:hypothetical protein
MIMPVADAIPFAEVVIEDAITLDTSHFFATQANDGSVLSIGCARRGGDIQIIVIPDRYHRPSITTPVAPVHRFKPKHYADSTWFYQASNIVYAPITTGARAKFIDNLATGEAVSFRYDNSIYGVVTMTFSYTFSREEFAKAVKPCKSKKIFAVLNEKFGWAIAVE